MLFVASFSCGKFLKIFAHCKTALLHIATWRWEQPLSLGLWHSPGAQETADQSSLGQVLLFGRSFGTWQLCVSVHISSCLSFSNLYHRKKHHQKPQSHPFSASHMSTVANLWVFLATRLILESQELAWMLITHSLVGLLHHARPSSSEQSTPYQGPVSKWLLGHLSSKRSWVRD